MSLGEAGMRALLAVVDRVSSALDRYPLNSPFVHRVAGRYLLPAWFLTLSAPSILTALRIQPILFFDARLYLDATRAWLAGSDPWLVEYRGFFFAAPPPTLLPLVPFAVLPDPVGWMLLGGLVVAGALATVRMLRLPAWWLLFPPIVHGAISGNIQLLLVPILLSRGAWLAPFLKVYALVPLVLLRRWRTLVVVAALLLVTAPILPWGSYLARFIEINAILADQARYGLSGPVLVALLPLGLACLWIVRGETAAWLAVPALWPSQQWYYATLVIPTRSQVVAAVVATPFAASGFVALVVIAFARLVSNKQARRAAVAGLAPEPSREEAPTRPASP